MEWGRPHGPNGPAFDPLGREEKGASGGCGLGAGPDQAQREGGRGLFASGPKGEGLRGWDDWPSEAGSVIEGRSWIQPSSLGREENNFLSLRKDG